MGFHVKYQKPRRAKGTRFFALRNYLAGGLVAVTAGIIYLVHLSPIGKGVYKFFEDGGLEVGEIDRDRNRLMATMLAPRAAQSLIEGQEELERTLADLADKT